MSICDALIADFEDEAILSRRVLAAVPDDRLDWRPHPKSMTLAQLAGHVAHTPAWLPAMLEDVFDFAQAAGSFVPFLPTSQADLLAVFDRHATGFRALLADRSDAFLTATWTMRSGEQVFMAAPRHQAIRQILIHHVIHHRGQLTVYLRLLGVAVPGTYGPTADDSSMT